MTFIGILLQILVKVLPDILPFIVKSEDPAKKLAEFVQHVKEFKKK